MPRARLNPLAYAHVIRELQHGPSTAADAAEASGLAPRTARDFLVALERVGGAHVVSWDVDARGHAVIPVWSIGAGVSVPAPIGASGLRHRARKLAAAHGCTASQALAVLLLVDGHAGKAAARLVRQGFAAA